MAADAVLKTADKADVKTRNDADDAAVTARDEGAAAAKAALDNETEDRKAADGVQDATLRSRAGWALRVNERLALKADMENVTARLTAITKAVENENVERAAQDWVLATADESEAKARAEADVAALDHLTEANKTINAALDQEVVDRKLGDGKLATEAAELREYAELLGAAAASLTKQTDEGATACADGLRRARAKARLCSGAAMPAASQEHVPADAADSLVSNGGGAPLCVMALLRHHVQRGLNGPRPSTRILLQAMPLPTNIRHRVSTGRRSDSMRGASAVVQFDHRLLSAFRAHVATRR